MNTGDVIQIEVPDFDPDINEGLPIQEHQDAQGSASITQQSFERSDEGKASASSHQDVADIDWPDAIPVKSCHNQTRILNKIYQHCQQEVR